MQGAHCQNRLHFLIMTSASPALAALALLALFSPTTVRSADLPPPTGEEILRLVRMSQASQDLQRLKGRLRIETSDLNEDLEGKEYPFDLSMTGNVIRFVFPDPPKESVNLDLNNNGTTLTRVTASGKIEVPAALYGERVRQTAINFEDLSMRFLYWRNSKVVNEEKVAFQNCWVVRVPNPDNRGPYRTVDVWVHKDSGGILQMRAYDRAGKIVKEFKVVSGQKYKGAYILKKMRVTAYNPATNKPVGRTYLEIADPD
jgi:hypothetical protein